MEGNKASIQGIYLALFGRPADPAGLSFFNGVTNNGQDLAKINGLAGTDEYLSRFTGFSNDQVVNAIFKAMFGRDADEGGLKFFVGELAAGRLSIENIAINILDGARNDDKSIIENKLTASDLFTRNLDTIDEQALYAGPIAAEMGRQFLAPITNDPSTVPTLPKVTAYISTLPPGGSGQPAGTLSVQQVLDGAAKGGHYILADRLDKIVANPDVMKNADSYQLTNSIGGVGAVTVEGAKVLLGAKNATNFDFSLADTSAAIKGALATIITEADTIAVLGAKEGETLDFSSFSRGVILNGGDNVDVLKGTQFNDVFYGGGGTNTYASNGGSDTFRLSDSGTDFIFLSSSATGGLGKSGPMHIYGWGKEDKFIVSNSDFSTNLEGSWTWDDYYYEDRGLQVNSSGRYQFDLSLRGTETHRIGLFDIYGTAGNSAETDGTDFLREVTLLTKKQGSGFEMGVNWKGFFQLDDISHHKTYLYYADTGSDTVIENSEAKLVAVLHDSPAIHASYSFMV